MSRFHRLILGFLAAFMAWLPASSFASFPATSSPNYTWLVSTGPNCGPSGGSSRISLSDAELQAQNQYGIWTFSFSLSEPSSSPAASPVNSVGSVVGTRHSNGSLCNDSATASKSPSGSSLQCPSSSTLSGSSCTCTLPSVEDPTHTSCVQPPTACQAAATAGATAAEVVSLGWLKGTSGVGGAFTVTANWSPTSCTSFGASLCVANFQADTSSFNPDLYAAYRKGDPVNGFGDYYVSGVATATSASCASPTPSTNTAAPPPCAGQSGFVNGVSVCLATESDASKSDRAAAAASAAAAAAAAASAASGGTASAQSTAAAAAASAAASIIMGGGSASAAAAAGAAAGTASPAGAAGAASAAAAAAANNTAAAASLAAGNSSSTASAAGSAAGEAAAAAMQQGLGAGAAAAAGAAAGAAIGHGSSAAGAAAAGAGAGAAAGAAGVNVLPPTNADIGDFCKANPKATMCSTLGAATDTAFAAPPSLYTRKYPDGLTGVWNTAVAGIKATPLFSLVGNLMPTNIGAGSCPSWLIDFNFGKWANFGSHDVAPPCWVWDFGRVVIIISALLLARALIFGG